MPIVVEHGGRAGTTAGQMIGQAGQANLDREQRGMMQLRQLMQQREMQRSQIQAQSEMQMQAADIAMDQTALRAGLQRELQETDFVQQRQQMQEKAQLEAEQWETRYTAKDRQDIARLNNGKKQLMQNPNFSDEERAAAMRTIDMQIAGIEPSLIPSDPDKQTFAPGRGPQDLYVDENSGALMGGYARDGSPRVQVQPQNMPKALEVKNQMERENSLAESRLKLMILTVKGDEGETPRYEAGVIDSILKRTYPWYHKQEIERNREAMQEAKASQAQQADEGVQARAENVAWDNAKRSGLDIQEIDKSLPLEIGLAQAVLREYEEYEDVPDDKKQAWLEAFKTYSNALNSLEQ